MFYSSLGNMCVIIMPSLLHCLLRCFLKKYCFTPLNHYNRLFLFYSNFGSLYFFWKCVDLFMKIMFSYGKDRRGNFRCMIIYKFVNFPPFTLSFLYSLQNSWLFISCDSLPDHVAFEIIQGCFDLDDFREIYESNFLGR